VRTADLSPAGICDEVAGSRGAAAAARISRCAPSTLTHTAAFASPTLVIVAPAACVAPPETLAAVRRHPHLLVAVRETTAAVGPFVVPGRTPCIRCLELARSDRDRQWPTIAAQLIAAGRATEPCDVALATLAASLVTLHALAWIDSDRAELPTSAGGVIELGLSDLRLRRRSLAAHAACGCGVLGNDDTAP
jgi:bacteriocin biosynthesis cyclodehydratase domain-containing protein